MSGDAIPVELIGVRIELPTNQPIVLLKELGGARFLPIWIGAGEATGRGGTSAMPEPSPSTASCSKAATRPLGPGLHPAGTRCG